MFAERDPAHARAIELGQRDHPVDLQALVSWADHELAAPWDLGVGRVDRVDVGTTEQLGDGRAGGRAEDRQRAVLGRDERDRELDVHVVGAPGGHQRELVQRHRPGHAAGRDEGHAVDVAALDVLDDPVQELVEATVVDRDGVLVTSLGFGAEREHERVVLEQRAGLGLDRAPVRIDADELVGDQRGAGVAHDRRQAGSAAPIHKRRARARPSADTRTPLQGRSRSRPSGPERARAAPAPSRARRRHRRRSARGSARPRRCRRSRCSLLIDESLRPHTRMSSRGKPASPHGELRSRRGAISLESGAAGLSSSVWMGRAHE